MAVRILLDEHLKPSIAHDLTALGYEVVCARDRGLANRRVQDWQLMQYCINDRRALCTINAHDLVREHDRRRRCGEDHYGVLLVDEWPPEVIYWALRQYLAGNPDPVLLMNQVVSLPKAADEFIREHTDKRP